MSEIMSCIFVHSSIFKHEIIIIIVIFIISNNNYDDKDRVKERKRIRVTRTVCIFVFCIEVLNRIRDLFTSFRDLVNRYINSIVPTTPTLNVCLCILVSKCVL
jgi:hypothetical protein